MVMMGLFLMVRSFALSDEDNICQQRYMATLIENKVLDITLPMMRVAFDVSN